MAELCEIRIAPRLRCRDALGLAFQTGTGLRPDDIQQIQLPTRDFRASERIGSSVQQPLGATRPVLPGQGPPVSVFA
jgi:hypothetical protein